MVAGAVIRGTRLLSFVNELSSYKETTKNKLTSWFVTMAPAINMKIIFVTLCLVQSFTALETDGGVGFKKLLDKSDLELVEQFFIGTVKCWRFEIYYQFITKKKF